MLIVQYLFVREGVFDVVIGGVYKYFRFILSFIFQFDIFMDCIQIF